VSETQLRETTMSKGDRMDAIEAAFAAKTSWPADFRISSVFYAARWVGYTGNSYIDAIDALAEKITDPQEIAGLPSKVAFARS